MVQEHGGDIYHYSSLLGIRPGEIIDFSASINPLGPSKLVKEVLLNLGIAVVNYPDPSCRELREAIALHYRIDPENILIGNGSTELIYLIPRFFKPQVIIMPVPTFSEYEKAGTIAGARMLQIKNRGDKIDLDRLISAFPPAGRAGNHAGGLLFLCNPNNPTGELIKRSDLLTLIDKAASSNIMVVIDEAFIDYAESESLIREVQEAENLIILRSFTKFFALPGLRVGYLVSSREIIEKLKGFKEPWSVNSIALMAATESLKDCSYIAEGLSFMEKTRKSLYDSLVTIDGIRPLPSHANFILIKLKKDGLKSDELFGSLLKRRIAVRSCKSFSGLDGEFIRVAVKGGSENRLLVDSLKSIIQE